MEPNEPTKFKEKPAEKKKEAPYNPWNALQHRMKGRGYSKEEVRLPYYKWKEDNGIVTMRTRQPRAVGPKASEKGSAVSYATWQKRSGQLPNDRLPLWCTAVPTSETEDFEMLEAEDQESWSKIPERSSSTPVTVSVAMPTASASIQLGGSVDAAREASLPKPMGPPRQRRPLK